MDVVGDSTQVRRTILETSDPLQGLLNETPRYRACPFYGDGRTVLPFSNSVTNLVNMIFK